MNVNENNFTHIVNNSIDKVITGQNPCVIKGVKLQREDLKEILEEGSRRLRGVKLRIRE